MNLVRAAEANDQLESCMGHMDGASGGIFRGLGARASTATSLQGRQGRYRVVWQVWRGVAGPEAAGLGGQAPGSGHCHVVRHKKDHDLFLPYGEPAPYKPTSLSKPEAKPHFLQSGGEEIAHGRRKAECSR